MRTISFSYLSLMFIFFSCTTKRSGESKLKIIGGQDSVRPGYFLSIFNENSMEFYCAAIYLQKNWAVTAAHCVDNPSTPIQVSWGNNKEELNDIKNRVGVSAIIIHDLYSNTYNGNDIALLHLDDEIPNGAVSPISINQDNLVENSPVSIYGRGNQTTIGSIISSDIKKIETRILETNDCKTNIDEHFGRDTSDFSDKILCAGSAGNESCFGDSGGPLVYTRRGETVLAGIVSGGGNVCAQEEGRRSYYTKVSAFNKWIKDNIENFDTGNLTKSQYRNAFCYKKFSANQQIDDIEDPTRATMVVNILSFKNLSTLDNTPPTNETDSIGECSYKAPNDSSEKINLHYAEGKYHAKSLNEANEVTNLSVTTSIRALSVATADSRYDIYPNESPLVIVKYDRIPPQEASQGRNTKIYKQTKDNLTPAFKDVFTSTYPNLGNVEIGETANGEFLNYRKKNANSSNDSEELNINLQLQETTPGTSFWITGTKNSLNVNLQVSEVSDLHTWKLECSEKFSAKIGNTLYPSSQNGKIYSVQFDSNIKIGNVKANGILSFKITPSVQSRNVVSVKMPQSSTKQTFSNNSSIGSFTDSFSCRFNGLPVGVKFVTTGR